MTVHRAFRTAFNAAAQHLTVQRAADQQTDIVATGNPGTVDAHVSDHGAVDDAEQALIVLIRAVNRVARQRVTESGERAGERRVGIAQ